MNYDSFWSRFDVFLGELEKMIEPLEKLANELNLAALDCAIEAARAKEDGRGFAVVAEQVRKTAEDSRRNMKYLNESVLTLSNADRANLKTVSEDLFDVYEYTAVVVDIANQINLLALNAAIEGARAGEIGREFAKKAENIRQLAEKSREQVTSLKETLNPLKVEHKKVCLANEIIFREPQEITSKPSKKVSKKDKPFRVRSLRDIFRLVLGLD
ncbi:MAG: methyl-accepting chemotaxis protein [Bacteroidota bacterium]